MKTCKPRELRKIATIDCMLNIYRLIGFYITGSTKVFKTKKEAISYAKSKGWKVTNPLKI